MARYPVHRTAGRAGRRRRRELRRLVDVVHARLLLAHLPDPLGLVARWRTQLRPGGVLLLDEIESMTTPPGALRRYEDLVAAEGGTMCAGPILAALGGRCPEVDVDDGRAARMYGMNLAPGATRPAAAASPATPSSTGWPAT